LRTIVDPLGNTQEYVYDERSRVGEVIDENGDSTTFTYYADNQRHTLTDANGNVTTWTYDNAGRVHTETNELGHTETYFYDEFNRLAEVVDRNGRIVRYIYNGRLLEFEQWVESGDMVRQFTYSYRLSPLIYEGTSGQLRLVVDTGQDLASAADDLRHNYGYDDHGRVEFSEVWIAGLDVSIETLRSYDLGDRVIGTQFSFDTSPEYEDAYQDGAVDHENSYSFDTAGRIASLTQSGPAVSAKHVELAYNRAGQFAAIDRYAATTPTNPVASTSYSYDARGRVTSIDHDGTAPGSIFAETHSYTYDDANRPTSYTNVRDSVFDQYGYDARGQLTSADHVGTAKDETYAYDDNGNRINEDGQSYQIDPNNKLLVDDTYIYEYDNEGNRTRREPVGGNTYSEYTWDHRNRLTQVTEGDEFGIIRVIKYTYDVFDQLVGRTESYFDGSNEKSVFIHDGGQIVLQFHRESLGSIPVGDLGVTDLSHRYWWGPEVDQLLAEEQVEALLSPTNNETLWALTDHLGSVRDMVDSNGTQRLHREFDAFGQIINEEYYDASGAIMAPAWFGFATMSFGYTSRPTDETTALQNNLHRWYDPAVGRWISEDPIGFAGGDANLSRYVGNAPTRFIDSDGLDYSSTSGEGQVQKVGREAHRKFGRGTKLSTDGSTGPITDRLDVNKNTATVNELKPEGRLQNPRKMKDAEKQLLRQMEAAQDVYPEKTIRGKLWKWTKDSAGEFKHFVVKRYKYVKGKGVKGIAKKVPGVGTIAALAGLYGDCQAKGLGGGLANSGLDAVPFVGTGKGIVEIIRGEDFIPDQRDADE
jgi:RHS repeat-associated protein